MVLRTPRKKSTQATRQRGMKDYIRLRGVPQKVSQSSFWTYTQVHDGTKYLSYSLNSEYPPS